MGRDRVTAEEFAKAWDVPKSAIEQALAVLNREGLVSQKRHSTCNDGSFGVDYIERAKQGKPAEYLHPSKWGGRCWHPNTYTVIKKK